jgi:hypothetical protein
MQNERIEAKDGVVKFPAGLTLFALCRTAF